MPKTIFNTKMKYEESREAPEWLSEILEKQMGSVVHENIIEVRVWVLRTSSRW